MNIASVLVETKPENLTTLSETIASISWAEIHHKDEDGRLIITIEGESSDEDIKNFQLVKSLTGVISATMMQYCFENESIDPETFKTVEIPAYLKSEDSQLADGGNYYQRLRRLSNFSNQSDGRTIEDHQRN